MTLAHLVTAYGYPALFLGTFLEGETFLVLGGLAARQGYLALPWVMILAFVAGFSSSQIFFILGRARGRPFLEKRRTWKARADKVDRLLDRHGALLALAFRFFYGFRSIVPLVFGMGRMKTVTFLLLNAAGAAVWAVLVASAGYLFGAAVEALLGTIRSAEEGLLILALLVGVGFWIFRFLRHRRRDRLKTTTADPGS